MSATMNASSARRSTGKSISATSGAGVRPPRPPLSQSRNSAARSTLDGALERLLDPLEQVRKVRPTARRTQQLLSADTSESKLLERARERPRKPGRRCHGREVLERLLPRGIERRSARLPLQHPARCSACGLPSPSATIALRAASCVRLTRCRPKVAGRLTATSRARSSAAPRDAPTISAGVFGNARAQEVASGRQPVSGKRGYVDAKSHRAFPGHVPGIRTGSATLPCAVTLARCACPNSQLPTA